MASSADLAIPRQYTLGSVDSLRQPLEIAGETTRSKMPSNGNTTASDSKYSQPECLLFRLPPKLRIYIFTHAMTPNTESTASNCAGDIKSMVYPMAVASSAPSIVLLLACRLIFREAEEYFIDAQRAFRSSNNFSLG
jgi:hypothetical protein